MCLPLEVLKLMVSFNAIITVILGLVSIIVGVILNVQLNHSYNVNDEGSVKLVLVFTKI